MILTKSMTRFARNTLDSIKVIRELKTFKIGVYFEKERVNTLMEKSEQMITVLSSITRGESESISINSKQSVVRRLRSGTFIISSPPHGYENNEHRELVIKKKGVEIIRWAFDEHLGGRGLYTIAAELETAGVPTTREAKEWLNSMVRGIPRNCAYEGDLLLQKTYTTDGVPFTYKNNRGELPQYLIADGHEPIITREEVMAICQIYEYRREQQCVEDTSVYQKRYTFSSQTLCGECGTRFRRQRIYVGKPYEKIQWCCCQHTKDSKKCSQKAVHKDITRAAFLRPWSRLASNYEETLIPVLVALKAIQGNPEQDREMQEIEQNIQELKRQGCRLDKILTEGNISPTVFIRGQNQIEAQLEADRRRLRQLQGQKVFEWEISQTGCLISVFRNRPAIPEAYDEELFLLLVERITVLSGHRLVFRLKNGLGLGKNEQEVS